MPRKKKATVGDRLMLALEHFASDLENNRPLKVTVRQKPIVDLELPFPPTINTYWRRVGNQTILSADARQYRKDVLNTYACRRIRPMQGPLKVSIIFYRPDKRRRDLDNLPKGLLDSLKHAGVYEDDSQIEHLDMKFGPVRKGGLAVVTIIDLPAEQTK